MCTIVKIQIEKWVFSIKRNLELNLISVDLRITSSYIELSHTISEENKGISGCWFPFMKPAGDGNQQEPSIALTQTIFSNAAVTVICFLLKQLTNYDASDLTLWL